MIAQAGAAAATADEVMTRTQPARQEDMVAGRDPRRLKLELTECLLLHDVPDVVGKMGALKAQGIGFALDDFGTGYSSLSYLRRLPLDQIKIDQSFVRELGGNPHDDVIVRAIIALVTGLGLEVIAEGVETEAQLDFLSSSGCCAHQSFYFSRPLPADRFEEFAGGVQADAPRCCRH